MAWLRPIKISRRVLKTLVILGDRTTINWVVCGDSRIIPELSPEQKAKMKRRAICIAFFLAFLVLLSLVQESQEITGILIPRRIPKCRRASNRRKVRSCRRGTIKSLVPVFVFTESEIERQKFLR